MITSARLPAKQILVSIGTLGASSQIGEILPPYDFFDCPVLSCSVLSFFLEITPRSNRWINFNALWLKQRVSVQLVQGCLLWAYNDGLPYLGEICPQNSPKMGVNRQFQAKTAQYKNCNISETINRIKTQFKDQAETGNCTSWWSNITQIKSNMAAGGHLEKWI